MLVWIVIGDFILISSYLKSTSAFAYFAHPNPKHSTIPMIPMTNRNQLFWYTIIYNVLLVFPGFLIWVLTFIKVLNINEHFDD